MAKDTSKVSKSAKSPTEKKLDRSAQKSANFVKLVQKRTSKALKAIDSVGNLSNRNSYTYTDDQVAKVFAALENAVAVAKKRFDKTAPAAVAGFTLS
jgi:hypothetical protein